MAKIESLKNYIGVLNEDEFIKLSKQIYDITISSVKITQSTKNGIFKNKFLEFLHQVEKYFLQDLKKMKIKSLQWLVLKKMKKNKKFVHYMFQINVEDNI